MGKKVNLHVFEKGDPEVELNLKIRDHLRNNENDRKAYGALKQTLVAQDTCHEKVGGLRIYTLKKNAFIQNLLKKIGYNRVRFVFGMHVEEQEIINGLCQKYCHDTSPITNWHDPAHKHCTLYQGVQAVGYAHVHLMDHKIASIITFVIAEPKRKQGLGKAWIHLIEKWLRLKNYLTIRISVSDEFIPFFKAQGFNASGKNLLEKKLPLRTRS